MSLHELASKRSLCGHNAIKILPEGMINLSDSSKFSFPSKVVKNINSISQISNMYQCIRCTRNWKEINGENAVPLLRKMGEDRQRNTVVQLKKSYVRGPDAIL